MKRICVYVSCLLACCLALCAQAENWDADRTLRLLGPVSFTGGT